MAGSIQAGASSANITPEDSQFLFGYPHVERYSSGVHDPLMSSVLFLSDGKCCVMFISCDIIFVDKGLVERARCRISEAVDICSANILISATHTHSGPITVDYLSNEADPVVPKADDKYIRLLEYRIVKAGIQAYNTARPARLGMTTTNVKGVGANCRDPSGPSDPEVSFLMVQSADGIDYIACMLICSMHPTVLHEDSTLISGDFPGMAREYLQNGCIGKGCPVLYHTGPCGNQSPRHVVSGNTFEEAERLGQILGRSVSKAIHRVKYSSKVPLSCAQEFVDLPDKIFPSVEEAEKELQRAIEKLEHLRRKEALRQEIRTAECDWFGAEESLILAQAAAEGRVKKFRDSCLPAEIQIIKIGDWAFVAWPGEIFVEYSLVVKALQNNTWIISWANVDLQGYIVTEEAAQEGGYEASNSLFPAKCGQILVEKTLKMLAELD